MDKNGQRRIQSALISDSARDSAKEYQMENLKTRRQKEEDFLNQALDYRDFVFSPEGYEGVVLALYIATIPYLMGLMFLFLFVAEANYEYFLEFNLASYFVIWAIGYEVCAALILITIFAAWLNHIKTRYNQEQLRKKPSKKYGF